VRESASRFAWSIADDRDAGRQGGNSALALMKGSRLPLKWKERPQAGGRFAIWLIREAARRCGRRFVRPFLYPITLYFYLRRRVERQASATYLARVHRRAVGPLAVLAHIHAFASIILDRVFLLTRGFAPFDIRLHGYDQLQAQIARGHGVLLLGAHLGSFEALSVLKQERPDLPLKVVMDRQQTADLNRLLYTMNPDVARQIIEVGTDPGEFALQLQSVVQQGGIIGLLGDRIRGGESAVTARFLGAPADFPAAPYLIASMLKVPIVLGFGIYRGGNRYDLHFEVLAESIQIPRGERPARLREWVQRYAERLEHYTRLAPDNWFNFYDFWHRPADDSLIDVALPARKAA
jgi:predicted LPLAT superfamily acyltransferase